MLAHGGSIHAEAFNISLARTGTPILKFVLHRLMQRLSITTTPLSVTLTYSHRLVLSYMLCTKNGLYDSVGITINSHGDYKWPKADYTRVHSHLQNRWLSSALVNKAEWFNHLVY